MMASLRRRFTIRRTLLLLCLLVFSLLLAKLYVTSSMSFGKDTFVKGKSQQGKQVDIVVVEEHHEVLEYWFDAANKGIIPKSGNVLLHIDAHSDMAPPELVDNYPFFRWPKNKAEVKTMMQSNDVFIQAAAMSGLFSKVIWVWPSWDEDTHESDNMSHLFGGGWTEVVYDGEKEKAFCECEYDHDSVTRKSCFYLNRTAFAEDDYDGTEINADKCTILGSIVYQELVDYSALNQMLAGTLVKKGESLLLDIDQDFFGCVLRGELLVAAGMQWEEVEEIDEMLNDIFCPKVTQHETLINELLQNIVEFMVEKCKSTTKSGDGRSGGVGRRSSFGGGDGGHGRSGGDGGRRSRRSSIGGGDGGEGGHNLCLTARHPVSNAFRSMYNQFIKKAGSAGVFCDNDARERERKLSILMEGLLSLTTAQLRAVLEIGFCMQTSPRSYNKPGFQICHGANPPNSSVVTVHMPGDNELRLRLSRLQRLIHAKGYPTPGIVTLCRSVRDGYCPVPHFSKIEKSVLSSVLKSRPEEVRYNIVYDKNLLGGKKGWPSRKRGQNLVKNKLKRKMKSVLREK